MLKTGDLVGITACSDPFPVEKQSVITFLEEKLRSFGLIPKTSPILYKASASGEERAKVLMKFYESHLVKAVFDVSGGNLANETLEYLNFETLKAHPKPLFGYSDLTVLLNGVYKKTGTPAYLYQVRNLVGEHGSRQSLEFCESLFHGKDSLFNIPWKWIQGSGMEGVVIGGNLRCFLKLSGTSYMPDFQGKLLFLESYGGGEKQIRSLLTQLRHMGVYRHISGLLLGTFTKLEQECGSKTLEKLVLDSVRDPHLPIALTKKVGHGSDAKCLPIGVYCVLRAEKE